MSYAKAKAKYDESHQEPAAIDRSLMCSAPGCPNRWSVDNGARQCSAHAWRDAKRWTVADITAQQQDAENDRRFGQGSV